MANALELKVLFPSDAELAAMFGTVPKLEYYQVLDKAIEAGAKVVAARAKQLAPRSTKSDRDKRSAKQKQKADWDYPLWKTIKYKVKRYGGVRGFGVVGPSWPRGNKAYFNTSPKGNKGHHWGYAGAQYPRRNGTIHTAGPARVRAQVRNWIVESFDETRPQQLDAIKATVTALLDKVMRDNRG